MTDLFNLEITEKELKDLLNTGTDITLKKDNQTVVQYYARNNKWNLVKVFAENIKNRSVKEKEDALLRSALLTSVSNMKIDCAEALVDAGSQVSRRINLTQMNIFHFAVMLEEDSAIRLLQKLADHPDAKSELSKRSINKESEALGDTPLMLAAKLKKWKFLTLLYSILQQEPTPDAYQYAQILPLIPEPDADGIDMNLGLRESLTHSRYVSIFNKNLEEIKEILKYNLYPATERDENDNSPLLKFANDKKWQFVEALVDLLKQETQLNEFQYNDVLALLPDEPQFYGLRIKLKANRFQSLFNTDLTEEDVKAIIAINPHTASEQQKENVTPVVAYAQNNDWEKVLAFMDTVPPASNDNVHYETVLFLAMLAKNEEIVTQLLAANITIIDAIKKDLAHTALLTSNPTIITAVLNSDLPLSVQDNQGKSPILFAAESQLWETVEAIANKLGQEKTPNEFQYSKVIELLKGVEGQDKLLDTLNQLKFPSLFADDLTAEQIQLVLANYPKAAQEKNDQGKTALMLLVEQKKWDLVQVFIEALNDSETIEYKDILLIAKQHNQWNIVSLLVDKLGQETRPNQHQYKELTTELNSIDPTHDVHNKLIEKLTTLSLSSLFDDAITLEQIKKILEVNPSEAKEKNNQEKKPLLIFAENDNWEAVELFIKTFSVNSASIGFEQALFLALKKVSRIDLDKNQLPKLNELIDKLLTVAYLPTQNDQLESAILIAAKNHNYHVVKVIVDKLKQEEYLNSYQYSEVISELREHSIKEQSLEQLISTIKKYTLASLFDENITKEDVEKVLTLNPAQAKQIIAGKTPLMLFVEKDNLEIVNLFVEKLKDDADKDLIGFDQALLAAIDKKVSNDVINALLTVANPAAQNADGVSAILLATRNKNWDLVSVLFKRLGMEKSHNQHNYYQVIMGLDENQAALKDELINNTTISLFANDLTEEQIKFVLTRHPDDAKKHNLMEKQQPLIHMLSIKNGS